MHLEMFALLTMRRRNILFWESEQMVSLHLLFPACQRGLWVLTVLSIYFSSPALESRLVYGHSSWLSYFMSSSLCLVSLWSSPSISNALLGWLSFQLLLFFLAEVFYSLGCKNLASNEVVSSCGSSGSCQGPFLSLTFLGCSHNSKTSGTENLTFSSTDHFSTWIHMAL